MLNYHQILYTLGENQINNDEALFKNLDKFFSSISELYRNMTYCDKWVDMTGPIRQHILVSLFSDKTFSRNFFENYMEGKVDFSQYKEGNILLAIECFIGKNTLESDSPLDDLLNNMSFAAINHETPEEQRCDYSKKQCKELTGQENADFQGKRAIAHKNGDISLETYHYKDVKTFDSGMLKGRLAIKYDLYSVLDSRRLFDNIQNLTNGRMVYEILM